METKTSVREQLQQEIEQAPDEILVRVLELMQKLTSTSSSEKSDLPYRPASGKSLVDYQGGWAGDNFEDCLQLVYDSRSKVNFSKHEPF